MSRDSNQQIAQQDEARKDQYTGMIQQTESQIPSNYTPEQVSALTTADLGGIDAGYGNLRDEMMRRASATGDSAGVPESLVESNEQSIRDKAQAGAQLQTQIFQYPTQQALAQASVYQPALSGMLYDRYPQQPSNTTGSIIGAAGSVAAAGIAAF